jgi:TP901 family phage tail tape measure protein
MSTGIQTSVTYTLHDEITKRLGAIEAKLKHFDSALEKSDKKVAGFGKGASNFAKNFKLPDIGKKAIESLDAIPNLNTNIIGSAAGLANPYVAAGAAIVAVGAFAVDATKGALQFNDGMAKVNVTARLGKQELGALGDRLKALPLYGTDLQAIPESFNRIISATGDVNKSTDIMAVSLKAARANFGDLDVTANAIVNTMGSAGDEFANATQVSDMLTKTMQLGNAEFNDLANYLPRIIPYAKQLGFTTNEVAGAMATLTAKGQTADQVSMLLQNTFTALGDTKKRANIQKFVDVFDANGKIKPFAEVFTNLRKGIDGMTNKELAEFKGALDLDAQAGAAFQGLIMNSELLTKNIGDIKNAAGETTKALTAGAKPAADNIALLKEKWDKAKNAFGDKLIPVWDKITDGFVKVVAGFEKLEEKTGIFSAAWKILTSIVKIAFSPFLRMWQVAKWVSSALGSLGSYLQEKFPNAMAIASKVVNVLVGGFKDLYFIISETWSLLANIASFDFEGIKQNISNFRNNDYAINGEEPAAAPAVTDYVHKVPASPFANMFAFGMPLATAPATPPATPANDSKFDLTATTKDKDDKKDDKAKAPKGKTASADNLHSLSGDKGNRSIVVNIKSLVEHLTLQTTNIANLGASAIRKHVEEALVMSVRDAELALASQ